MTNKERAIEFMLCLERRDPRYEMVSSFLSIFFGIHKEEVINRIKKLAEEQ